MNRAIILALVVILIHSQGGNSNSNLRSSNLDNVNNFFKSLHEFAAKCRAISELIASYTTPLLNKIQSIKDLFFYIFSVQHIITALLFVIFLIFLMREEQTNDAIYYHESKEGEEGQRILQPL